MKKIALLLLVILFTTGSSIMAQDGPRGGQRGGQRNMDPKERAERMTERMAKEYALNDTQKKELYEVNLAANQRMVPPAKGPAVKGKADSKCTCENCTCENCNCKAAKTGKQDKQAKKSKEAKADKPSAEEREKRMAEMKKSREDYDAKIKQIFTKDQYEAYTKKQAERQQRIGDGNRRGPRTNN